MFSAFYFFSFFYTQLTFQFVVNSILLYGIFVGLYLQLTHCPRHKVIGYLIAMTILGTLGSSQNPSSSVFFGYTAFFAGFYLSKRQTLTATTIICLNLLVAATLFDLWYAYYLFPGLVPTIAMAFLGLFIQTTEKHAIRERQSADENKQLVKVAERERIARDLHDTLGHTLTSIALKAQLAKKLGDKGETQKALTEIDEVAKLASETLSDVRSAISGYKNKGLKEQLSTLESRLRSAGFKTKLDNHLPTPNARREAAIILMITEAVTNIIRHSNGDMATLQLSATSNTINILVSDNGSQTRYVFGNGLSGMRERLQAFDGTLNINTDNGFRLTIGIPAQDHD